MALFSQTMFITKIEQSKSLGRLAKPNLYLPTQICIL